MELTPDNLKAFEEIVARYPGRDRPEDGGRRRRLTSTLIEYGRPAVGGCRPATAMARTVGLPAAIATRLLLDGQLPLTGCHIPTHPAIYRPILAQLEAEGRCPGEHTPSLLVVDLSIGPGHLHQRKRFEGRCRVRCDVQLEQNVEEAVLLELELRGEIGAKTVPVPEWTSGQGTGLAVG